MRIGASSIKLAALLGLAAAAPAQAGVLSARIDAVRSGAGSLQKVHATLDWARGSDSGRLRLQAAALDFPALTYQARQLDWQCPLQRLPNGHWRCEGAIATQGGGKDQRLAIDFGDEATVATLDAGKARVSYRSGPALDGAHRVQLQKVPVAWLGAFLGGLWSQGRWNAGTLSGEVVVAVPDHAPLAVDTDLQVAGLDLETPDGLLAAAGLEGRLQVHYRGDDARTTVDTRLQVAGGELLYERLYTKFPDQAVAIHVQAERRGQGPWSLPALEWRDQGVLRMQGSAALDAGNDLTSLDLQAELPDLAQASGRYLSGVLAPAGFGDMVLTGRASAHVSMRGGELSSVQANFDEVNAVDAKARFTLAGVGGDLAFTRTSGALASAMHWDSGALFGIGLGPATLRFTSSGGALALSAPVEVAALGGKLQLQDLHWQAPRGETGARFQFGLGVQSLDLASLSQRLGWPAFTGTVSGTLPSARYEDDVLAIDGGIRMQMFGGSLSMDHLVLERPFATAPSLSADVAIQDLDLQPLTRVFGFGEITGRLDGRIDGLRLVGWSPVSFDAQLHTDPAYEGKRRISQRAVRDISDVGGSGLAGGIQARLLGVFDDFGYARIGLGCRLRDNVCTMSGVGSAGDGYIIVEGAGLPRIQVVGFRRRVDWPTLVSRLRAATAGQAPVIQ